ncbi:MAG: hypothetical protein GTN74_13560 [Proteobacteria bacterium]|nr:hypothetical protein [Pseudomonadota bacterium]NIS71455.1 hypothetical protein [Pseudomonadota bacterium]
MGDQNCCKCGRYLPSGNLRYVVHIRVFADFDGVLSIPEGDIEGELERILQEVEFRDPKDLEREVYEEIGLLLCKLCRDRFVREATGEGESEGNGMMIH